MTLPESRSFRCDVGLTKRHVFNVKSRNVVHHICVVSGKLVDAIKGADNVRSDMCAGRPAGGWVRREASFG